MVKKFASLWGKAIAWRWLRETALFGAALALALVFNFQFWPSLLAFAIIVYLYFTLGAARSALRASYWLLVLLGISAAALARGGSYPLTLLPPLAWWLATGVLGAFLIGIAHSYLAPTGWARSTLYLALLFLSALIAFTLFPPPGGTLAFRILSPLALFVVLALLTHEYLAIGGFAGRRATLSALVLATIGVQGMLAVAFLPLGVVKSAALLVLFLATTTHGFSRYRRGEFSVLYFLRTLTILVVGAVVLFATTPWAL